MPFRVAILLALVAAGAAVGAAASGGFVAKAPAGSSPPVQVTKYYDPLP
ncbi:hypothetical protein GCM10009416_45010 [Craurococcus roseus]|uniref:Uncharacterized protein n=2 Tax=Craurococcus roseus TaxID=77585 RepID=A0ABN1G1X3_9PROT